MREKSDREITAHSENETGYAGASLAKALDPGSLVLLKGDLGAGKTVFIRGLINSLMGTSGSPSTITSPTFSLLNYYELSGVKVVHADLYRLDNLDDPSSHEVFDEIWDVINGNGIALVEWGEKFNPGSGSYVEVTITIGDDSDTSRNITIRQY